MGLKCPTAWCMLISSAQGVISLNGASSRGMPTSTLVMPLRSLRSALWHAVPRLCPHSCVPAVPGAVLPSAVADTQTQVSRQRTHGIECIGRARCAHSLPTRLHVPVASELLLPRSCSGRFHRETRFRHGRVHLERQSRCSPESCKPAAASVATQGVRESRPALSIGGA
jgi:hypothetical protein